MYYFGLIYKKALKVLCDNYIIVVVIRYVDYLYNIYIAVMKIDCNKKFNWLRLNHINIHGKWFLIFTINR